MQEVRQKSASLQDMQFLSKTHVKSSTLPVECYVCGKGLRDGHSITAKTLPNAIVLFCDVHYPLQ
ncbi:MAG: hypothetical protein OEM18_06830 [Nitrosopumilus sp.]|jgi:hypothetical protein|nr:hypothetical protein [Nitrosopumilus sp.]